MKCDFFYCRYCAKLPSDSFTRLVPLWDTEAVLYRGSLLYVCSIRLPINCPLKCQIVVSHIMLFFWRSLLLEVSYHQANLQPADLTALVPLDYKVVHTCNTRLSRLQSRWDYLQSDEVYKAIRITKLSILYSHQDNKPSGL